MRYCRYIERYCWVCGKPFVMKVRNKDDKILTDCFYSHMKISGFDWWAYEMLTNRDGETFFRPKYKNWKYKVLAPNKIMRRFVYWLYHKFNKPIIKEYFECPKCCKE